MKRLQSRNRKEADYYGRGTMKGMLSKASNAYEANAMTEAVTDSAFFRLDSDFK